MENRSCVHFGCCRQQFATLLDHNLVTLCVSLPRTPVTFLPSCFTKSPSTTCAPQSHRELHNFCSTSVCQFLSRTRLKDDLLPNLDDPVFMQQLIKSLKIHTIDIKQLTTLCKATSLAVSTGPQCQFCGAVFGDWGPCGRFGDKTRLFLLYLHLWSPHALGSPLEMWRPSILLVSTILSSFVTMFV